MLKTQNKKSANEEPKELEQEEKKRNGIKILNYSIWRILAYFIIFSAIGVVIETIFGATTKGVIESRRCFLYGPFSCIYGTGGVAFTLLLQYFKKNNITLFLGGFVIGSIIEYVISFGAEHILHVKWWDYSDMPFNINGRICLYFSLFWGLLAVFLIRVINPEIDKAINFIKKKVNIKILKGIIVATIIFMFFDSFATGVALKMFHVRMEKEYNLELKYSENENSIYAKLYENEQVRNVIDKCFSNKKILKTFPNLKLIQKNGKVIWVKDILTDIQPYYFKIGL